MNKEFICYMDAKDYRDMHKGTIKWCAVGTKPSENDTDVKLFASLPPAELTDDEIKEVYGEYFDVENCDWIQLQCIRAILLKAQEK